MKENPYNHLEKHTLLRTGALQDASTQASAPKMKSISVSVHVKGIDKGNVVM